MTRKDFKLVAEAILNLELDALDKYHVVEGLCVVFKDSYVNFDNDKFRAACGFPTPIPTHAVDYR